MTDFAGLFAFLLLLGTSFTLLLSREWRWAILALAVQYIGAFILVLAYWPVGMALTKVVVGWMAGAALALTQAGTTEPPLEHSWPAGRLFRVLAAALVLLVIFSVSPLIAEFLPDVSLARVWGSLTLIGMGLLQLGTTARPFRVILGLLTVLTGFEILYAAVEISLLVAGLLSAVTLGLALVGAYLISAPGEGERP